MAVNVVSRQFENDLVAVYHCHGLSNAINSCELYQSHLGGHEGKKHELTTDQAAALLGPYSFSASFQVYQSLEVAKTVCRTLGAIRSHLALTVGTLYEAQKLSTIKYPSANIVGCIDERSAWRHSFRAVSKFLILNYFLSCC